MVSRILGRLTGLAVLLLAGLLPSVANAATLYVSEFYSPASQVGSVTGQVYPQPAITDQTVSIAGSSTQSSAFNANTHAIMVECDADCSIVIGSNPTATTSNFLMGDGVPYFFAVTPGQKIAVISNTSGGSGSDVNITAVGGAALALGQTTMANSLPVTIASNQSAVPISGTVTATPPAFTSITASATGTTAATTATLAGVSAKTTYICGFTITSDATAAIAGSATVTGTITGTLNYIQNVGSATAAGILSQNFNPCIPASAVNTGIVVNSLAAGVGGNTAVTAWGYQQ